MWHMAYGLENDRFFLNIYPIYRAERVSKLHFREDALVCSEALPVLLLTYSCWVSGSDWLGCVWVTDSSYGYYRSSARGRA